MDALPPAQVPALAIEKLRFGWPGQPLLLSIEALSIATGERVFLRGPSGSGKSTLLGLAAGVLAPQSGRVVVMGQDLAQLPRARRDQFRGDHIGYVFQSFNLLPWLSMVENVLLPLPFAPERARRVGAAPREEAQRLLQSLGLDVAAEGARGVSALSTGQQQRVAVARALLGRPPLVIADEPTSALDEDTRDRFIDLLLAECSAAGSALLFVSHDSQLARHFHRQIDLQALQT